MNANTAGAVLLLTLAAVGIYQGKTIVWVLVAITAALAFVVADLETNPKAEWIAFPLALVSWLTTIAAFIYAVA